MPTLDCVKLLYGPCDHLVSTAGTEAQGTRRPRHTYFCHIWNKIQANTMLCLLPLAASSSQRQAIQCGDYFFDYLAICQVCHKGGVRIRVQGQKDQCCPELHSLASWLVGCVSTIPIASLLKRHSYSRIVTRWPEAEITDSVLPGSGTLDPRPGDHIIMERNRNRAGLGSPRSSGEGPCKFTSLSALKECLVLAGLSPGLLHE